MTAAVTTGRAGHDDRTSAGLSGTATLVRFVLRRDRIRLPAWLVGITVLLLYLTRALIELVEGDEQLRDMARFMEGPLGAVFGPGYGRDVVTVERYVVGVYGLFFFVLAALMSVLLVSRHTRVDEHAGRTELIRTHGAGRQAPLTAVLVVAGAANVVLALLLGAVMVANGFDGVEGLRFGASVGAVGWVFAGLTACSVQLSENSRTATATAGAVVAVAWVVRAIGDMVSDHGGVVSWLSPLAWSNQTRPYVEGRWWPLLLSVALAVAATAMSFVLSARRDLGAGLVAARPGRPTAARWLASPPAVAFRLQRARLVTVTAAVAVFGVIFGALTDQIADPADASADRIEMFGGSLDTLVEGYLGVITTLVASIAGVVAVVSVQAIRSEETTGRAAPLLATATSRRVWLASHLVVTSIGIVVMLAVVGATFGFAAAVSVGDRSHVWEVTAAQLAHAPGVLVVVGIAATLFGMWPTAVGATWTIVGLGLFVGLFGPILDLPVWLLAVVPMEHTGRPPLDDISLRAATILVAVAAALMAAGIVGFSRRDVDTA